MRQDTMQRDGRAEEAGQSICRMGSGIDTLRRGMRSRVVSDPGIARDRALSDRLYRHLQQ